MYRTSGSTRIRGKRRASASAYRQCVVARLPSRSPAAASTNTPEQIETTRPPDDRRAVCLGAGSRRGFIRISPPRNDDGARAVQRAETGRRANSDTAQGLERSRLDGADREAVPRHAEFRSRKREHLDNDAELEEAEPSIRHRHDTTLVTHG